jgi:hypothetical protein
MRTAVYVLSKELYRYPLGYDSIPRVVRRLDADNALVVLAKVSWLLEEWGDLDAEAQQLLAGVFLEGVALENAVRLITEEGGTVFFRTQVYILMKYIAMYSRDLGKTVGPNELKVLGKTLLQVTEIISSAVKQHRRLRAVRRPVSLMNDLDDLVIEIFTTSHYLRGLQGPGVRFALARARYLYINLHRAAAAERPVDFLNIQEYFREATGVELDVFLSAGISVIVYFLKHHVEARTFPDSKDFIMLRPSRTFKNSIVDRAVLDRFFEIISMPMSLLGENARGESKRTLAYDFLLMRRKPLVELTPDIFVPISISFLFERVTTGVYWIVLDHLNRAHSKELSDKFTRYNGILFQRYVEEVLERLSMRTAPAKETVMRERRYQIAKQEFRTPDLMLFGDGYAILIEASATRLQAWQTTSLGIPEAFLADSDKMIFHNTKSLDTFVQNLIAGKVVIAGIDVDSIKEIYPVIVTIEGFPRHFSVDAWLEEEIREEDLLGQDVVSGLSMLDIVELEYLEAFSEESLISILRGWHSEPGRLIPKMSINDYLRSAASMSDHALSEWSEDLMSQAFDEATQLLFGRSILATSHEGGESGEGGDQLEQDT